MAVETFEDNFIELNVEPEWLDKIHGFALGSWVQGGVSGVDNVPLIELAKCTKFLKKEVDTIIGLSPGGFLDANDFGTEEPTQQMLTDYALLKIGGTDPLKIWNGTRVKNLLDSNIWILTNTPDTDPPIFEWTNNGPDTVVVDVVDVAGKAPLLYASNKRKLTIREGSRIALPDGGCFAAGMDLEINIENVLDTGSLANGKDYCLFLYRTNGGENVLVVSLDKSAPQGLNPADVVPIGGCHTLCANAGTGMTYVEGGVTKDHPLNGFVANDILPPTVWCKNHRPFSEPEGTSYISSLDFWCDIYKQSGSGFNTKSVYQGAITRSRQYVDFVEDQFCVKKELLDDAEFAAAMLGSNEQTAVAGANEAGATTGGAGGRVDTAGRRMISIYGIEEGCGALWEFLRSTAAGGAVGSMYGPDGWINMTTSAYGPFAQSGGKGSLWGLCAVLLAGGVWIDSSGCGSRARSADSGRSRSYSYIGGRGRSRPMRLSM